MSESNDPKLPSFAHKLLWFLPDHLREEIEGDLLQRYHRDIRKYGPRMAKVRSTWNTIRFLRPAILFRKNNRQRSFPPTMFKNYFVIAFRNMMAHKVNSGINILSLVIGITSALITLSVIRYELSFDQFHSDPDRIYRVNRLTRTDAGELLQSGLPGPAVAALREKVTAISNIAGVQYYGPVQIDFEHNGEDRKFKEPNGAAFVDPQFFRILDYQHTDFRWLAGDPASAFNEPFNVVLGRSIAEKYFGTTDVVGKSIRLEGQVDCKITGVITDLPHNSDFPFTILVSYATLYEIEGDRMKDDWQSINADNQAFLLLPEGTNVNDVEAQFDRIRATLVDKDLAEAQKFRLQPLADVHRDARTGNYNHRTVDESALWIIGLTGLLLLLVGCINYINIATAQSTLRLKEIGVRKVLGGLRRQLVLQFLSETFILVTLACMASLLVAHILLQNMMLLTNIQVQQDLFTDPTTLASLGTLIVVITIVAGCYPAFVVSGHGIIAALKGTLGSDGSSVFFRRTLVVVQFAITQAFLIGSFVVINQLQYSRSMDLGFQKDRIVTLPIETSTLQKTESLRTLLMSNPSVERVSFSSSFPSGYSRNHWFVGVRRKGSDKKEDIGTEYQAIDTAYLGLYGLKLAAGRNFLAGDSLRYAIINERLSKEMGFENPEAAIGEELSESGRELTIVGVVHDFHESSSREKIGNMFFQLKPDFLMNASVKLQSDTESIQDIILSLEKSWATVYPSLVFDYKFFDENIDRLYREEKKLSMLLQAFSIVFLLVSCLGLYGLLSFVINRRMKEVAVRKVFGASVSQIFSLISRDYVILVLISFIIAAPVTYYFMNEWLTTYQYHIPITWWILTVPGLLALTIAMVTLSGKLVKAATGNPAETLKHE